MRIGLVAVSVALLAASCGGGATAVPGEGVDAAAPRVAIEIDRSEAETETLTVTAQPTGETRDDEGIAPSDGSSNEVGAAGPNTSVVAHAVVPDLVARAEPTDDASEVATLANPTPSGSPLVFLTVDDAPAVPGWVQVMLPIQPNGTTGWLQRDEVDLFANPYRIEVDRAGHVLRVYENGALWMETPIAIGTGDTPTPVGEFYLLELLAPPDPNGPYGPYAFGLSGFSEVLDSFGTADAAVIGLHGTNDPSAIGSDVSFGCIRMPNDVIERLAADVPLGTPVIIA